jgi:hypothetical protein
MIGRRRILTAVAAGVVCTIAVGLTFHPDPPERLDPLAFSQSDQSAPSAAWDAYPAGWDPALGAIVPTAGTTFPARPIYRHSIVPGGVYSRAEVEEAVFRMPDVAEHYRNVNIQCLAPAQVSRDGLYYASYRRDGAIFWTSYRLRVDSGETVLGDGQHLVRARCGNLLSEAPLKPTLPPQLEPIEPEMGTVEVPSLPMIGTLPHGPGFWIPFLPIIPVLIFPGGGGHGDHPGPGPTIPEPSPVGLVGLGLAAIAAAKLLADHRRRDVRRRKD